MPLFSSHHAAGRGAGTRDRAGVVAAFDDAVGILSDHAAGRAAHADAADADHAGVGTVFDGARILSDHAADIAERTAADADVAILKRAVFDSARILSDHTRRQRCRDSLLLTLTLSNVAVFDGTAINYIPTTPPTELFGAPLTLPEIVRFLHPAAGTDIAK